MRLKLVDYDAMRKAFNEKFKETQQLIQDGETHLDNLAEGFLEADRVIYSLPTIDAVPVTEAELKHLINDTITYIWRLEDRGCDKPEFGYDSRKALLEKLKQFYKEHFPENGCYCGERKDGEG